MKKHKEIENMRKGRHNVVFSTLRCLLCFLLVSALCGCGTNPEIAETMQEQQQGEAVQGDDMYVDNSEDKQNVADKNEMNGAENEALDDGQDSETDIEVEAAEGDNNVEAKDKENIENNVAKLDEDLKEELITELLQDRNKDTSVLKDSKSTKGCDFTIPEDFEKSQDIEGLYVNEHYPVDASTIYYTENDKDISIQLMSEKFFVRNMKAELKQAYGHDVEVELKEFEEIKIDGYPAFRILCNYTVNEITITQLEYIINADKSYVITYSQTDEYDRMEEFEASAETIRVES